MKELISEDAKLIRVIAVIGDFIIINLVFIILFLGFNNFQYNYLLSLTLQKYITILNLCYLPAIITFRFAFHNRMVSSERIIRGVILTITMHILLFTAVLALIRTNTLPRTFFVGYYLSALLFISIWRLIMRKIVKDYRRKGKNIRTAIIVGSNKNVIELYYEITADYAAGYRIKGVFDDAPIIDFPPKTPHLGEVKDVISYLENNPVNEVYCCLPSIRQDEILPIINYCDNHLIRFYSVPNVRNYLRRKMKMELIGEIPVLYIRDEPLQKPENRFVKRTFDLTCSTIFLCTIYPFLYLIIGAIIKITSPGPIYFKQDRSGKNGETFKCIKFRSMHVNKDSDKVQATKNDPRKTKFGDFLRKTNLDEFPQLINVWKGDMSLVGPRPHMLKHTDEYSQLINKYMVRHFVKPGITGWAQVTGFRGETKELSEMEGRVKKDIWYIENWSFLLDIRILYKTVANMVIGDKNAY